MCVLLLVGGVDVQAPQWVVCAGCPVLATSLRYSAWLQAARESVEKMQALEDHIETLEDALSASEAAKADMRTELDSIAENETHHRQMNDFYAGLLSNIQEQIAVAGSRPNSSASVRDGVAGQHMEEIMGAVRQSLGACSMLCHLQAWTALLINSVLWFEDRAVVILQIGRPGGVARTSVNTQVIGGCVAA